MIDRSALRAAYRQEEQACVAERLRQAAPATAVHAEAAALAARLIEGARERKASGLDAFLQTFGLGTDEGIALMCLAEALLRVPDTETADALIHDKLAGIDWGERLGDPDSTFVNAATFSLMLTGQVLRGGSRDDAGFANALRRAVGRLGEPVIRQATLQAMRILGGQFVFGRTIDEALERAAPEQKQGLTHSFDMLGEAAMTFADAERYRRSYAAAIARLAREANGGVRASPSISVKLSAPLPALRLPPRRGSQGSTGADRARPGAGCPRGRHPLHYRRRGSRAARAVDGHPRDADRRRRSLRRQLAGLRPRPAGLPEARGALGRLGRRGRPQGTTGG